MLLPRASQERFGRKCRRNRQLMQWPGWTPYNSLTQIPATNVLNPDSANAQCIFTWMAECVEFGDSLAWFAQCIMHQLHHYVPQPSSLSPPLSSPPPPSSPPPLPSPPSPSWSFLSSASIKFYWSVGCRPSETRWSPSSSSSFPGRGACVISLLFEILRIQDPQIPTNFQDSGSWILWTWLSCW